MGIIPNIKSEVQRLRIDVHEASEQCPWAAGLTEATTLGRLESADGVAVGTGDVWRLAALNAPLSSLITGPRNPCARRSTAAVQRIGAKAWSDRTWSRTRAIPVGESIHLA